MALENNYGILGKDIMTEIAYRSFSIETLKIMMRLSKSMNKMMKELLEIEKKKLNEHGDIVYLNCITILFMLKKLSEIRDKNYSEELSFRYNEFMNKGFLRFIPTNMQFSNSDIFNHYNDIEAIVTPNRFVSLNYDEAFLNARSCQHGANTIAQIAIKYNKIWHFETIASSGAKLYFANLKGETALDLIASRYSFLFTLYKMVAVSTKNNHMKRLRLSKAYLLSLPF